MSRPVTKLNLPCHLVLIAMSMILISRFASATENQNIEWKTYLTTAVLQADQNILTDDGVPSNADFSKFTKVGISGSLAIDEHWDGLVNLFFNNNYSSDVQSNPIDYALLSYRASNNASLFRIGRLRIPTWLMSDVINVGILYPWVRPPAEVYLLNPINSTNMVSYTHTIAGPNNSKISLDTYTGGGYADIAISGSMRGKTSRDLKLIGATLTAKFQHWSWRFSYNKANIYGTGNRYISAADGSTTTYPFEMPFGDCEFISTGVRGEIDRLVFWSEYAKETASKVLDQRSAGYLTVGYKLNEDKLMPHFTFSRLFDNTFSPGGVFSTTKGRQYTSTLGVNYFLSTNTVLKLEASRTTYEDAYALASFPNDANAVPGKNGNPNFVNIYGASFDASF